MKCPWLTTIDWPVNALLGKLARNTAVAATSSIEVNSPLTVSLNITFLMTSSSVIPSSCACSGICFSTNGVRTKPGQITFDLIPCLAPSLATAFARPTMPCFAAMYADLFGEAICEWTDPSFHLLYGQPHCMFVVRSVGFPGTCQRRDLISVSGRETSSVTNQPEYAIATSNRYWRRYTVLSTMR